MSKLILLSIFLVQFVYLGAQTIYSNYDDFKEAIRNASSGDEIVLANGTYNAESVKMENVQASAERPVIIRAQEPGNVILNDEAYFDFRNCSYIIVQGFIINTFEQSTVFKVQACNHIRITQNVIDGTNEPLLNDDGNGPSSAVWIAIQGLWNDPVTLSHHNRIDHNTFQNKHSLGNMIRIDGTNQLYVSQYDTIDHNYFRNMGPRAENEMEVIRVGWSAMSQSDGYATIVQNLFEECNGDPEIISVKCNKNTVAHNTFRRCQGTLALRHGNRSLVEGNFFLGEGVEGTGGIRLYGSDHKIVNNYFEGLTGSKWDAPITLTNGDAEEGSTSLSKHFRIERALIANNTVVNCDYGVELGFTNNGKYSKPPRDVVFTHNLISGSKNALVNIISAPVNMRWSDNLLYATGNAVVGQNITFADTEAFSVDPKLNFDLSLGMFIATSHTPTYSEAGTEVEVNYDVHGQSRVAPFNYGADEFLSSSLVYAPLRAADVGPNAMSNDWVSVSHILGEQENEWMIFPNPSTGTFRVSCSRLVDLKVYNLNGQCLLEKKGVQDGQTLVTGLSGGTYLLELNSEGQCQRLKHVILDE